MADVFPNIKKEISLTSMIMTTNLFSQFTLKVVCGLNTLDYQICYMLALSD